MMGDVQGELAGWIGWNLAFPIVLQSQAALHFQFCELMQPSQLCLLPAPFRQKLWPLLVVASNLWWDENWRWSVGSRTEPPSGKRRDGVPNAPSSRGGIERKSASWPAWWWTSSESMGSLRKNLLELKPTHPRSPQGLDSRSCQTWLSFHNMVREWSDRSWTFGAQMLFQPLEQGMPTGWNMSCLPMHNTSCIHT